MPAKPILHIAVVVPDIKAYDLLSRHSYLINSPYKELEVKLHVLLDEPGVDKELQIYRLALVELDLVDPDVAGLNNIEKGWRDEVQRSPK